MNKTSLLSHVEFPYDSILLPSGEWSYRARLPRSKRKKFEYDLTISAGTHLLELASANPCIKYLRLLFAEECLTHWNASIPILEMMPGRMGVQAINILPRIGAEHALFKELDPSVCIYAAMQMIDEYLAGTEMEVLPDVLGLEKTGDRSCAKVLCIDLEHVGKLLKSPSGASSIAAIVGISSEESQWASDIRQKVIAGEIKLDAITTEVIVDRRGCVVPDEPSAEMKRSWTVQMEEYFG
jgi:hypothetical protein